MAFISELTGRPVTDIDGTRIGVLRDLIARPIKGFGHPLVNAIVVHGRSGERVIPYTELAALLSAAIPLKRALSASAPYEPQDEDSKRLYSKLTSKSMQEKVCTNCGTLNLPIARFCNACGARL